MAEEPEPVYTTDEAAEKLGGISTTVLRRMARDRKIGYLRTGRTYTFPASAISAYIAGNTVKQQAPNPHGLTDRSLARARRGDI
jgi:excisionase family DNA binding protein